MKKTLAAAVVGILALVSFVGINTTAEGAKPRPTAKPTPIGPCHPSCLPSIPPTPPTN